MIRRQSSLRLQMECFPIEIRMKQLSTIIEIDDHGSPESRNCYYYGQATIDNR
jgi:hypothetical protein